MISPNKKDEKLLFYRVLQFTKHFCLAVQATQPPHETGKSCDYFIFKMRNLGLREVKWLPQGHTANKR